VIPAAVGMAEALAAIAAVLVAALEEVAILVEAGPVAVGSDTER
jgi:hypothetical protein